MKGLAIVAALMTATALLLPGVQPPAQSQQLAGTTLRIATWGGSWRDALDANIGKKLEGMGVRVEYVIGNPTDSLAKLVAARGRETPFDLMENSGELVETVIQEGFVQKLNPANVPNLRTLPAFAVSDYYVITNIAQDGILYNEQKFRENGIPLPETFSDLAHPKLKGHVAFPDVVSSAHWNTVVALAYEAGGNEASMEGAIDRVRQIDPLYYFPTAADMAAKFNLGDVWAAPQSAGWYVRLKRTGLPVAFSHPRIGTKRGALSNVYIHLTKGARNVRAAELFLNLYSDPDIQFAIAEKTGLLPSHGAARQRLAKNPEVASVLLLSDGALTNSQRIDWARFDRAKWVDTWNRFIGQ